MAKQINSKQAQEREANVAEALSKTELFFKENGKKISYIGLGIIAIAALIYAYKYLIVEPRHKEAQNHMFVAERNFREGNFELALKGDGNDLGFEQVIKKYGKRADKAIYYYAGVCELRLGNNEQAISYLKKYQTKDKYAKAASQCCIGDALVNSEKVKEAIPYFENAASLLDNFFAAKYLLKAALCYEELGNPQKAISLYKEIKDKYPQSPEGADIDKYISRAEALQN